MQALLVTRLAPFIPGCCVEATLIAMQQPRLKGLGFRFRVEVPIK